jgi:diaminopimelate epimerase
MLRGLHEPKTKETGATPFFKMAGGGNDFVVIDNRAGLIREGDDLARRVSTRRLSVGADGLMLIEPSARATFRMRYYNSDGSAADFCANGTRCAARFAFLNVIAPRKMTIETGAGVVGAEISEQSVTLALSSPAQFIADRTLTLDDGRAIHGSYIRVGVPHYVVFVERDLWEHDIEPLGRQLRMHRDLAPEGANVNFVVVRDRNQISLRTYERGVEGETLSCGSGIVASVSVSALFNRVDSPVQVLTRSGIQLQVQFERDEREGVLRDVRLTGDARVIYRGEIAGETTSGVDPDWVRKPTDEPPKP